MALRTLIAKMQGTGVCPVMSAPDDQLLDYIKACQTARLPGDRLAFFIGAHQVGYVKPDLAAALSAREPELELTDRLILAPQAVDRLNGHAAALAPGFGLRMRGELFDIKPNVDAPSLGRIDRGALPGFGVIGCGVHLNGYVMRADGLYLWVARRAAHKKLDGGKLDHIVAGGVNAGLSPREVLVKEAEEEAAMPAELAGRAIERARIAYAMERAEGLRRDYIYCYDVELPEDFTPRPVDGEVESFTLQRAEDVLAALRRGDGFKFNVSLVLIDFFIRHGLIIGAEAQILQDALNAGHL